MPARSAWIWIAAWLWPLNLEACQEFKGCLRFKDFLKLMRLILDFQDLISRLNAAAKSSTRKELRSTIAIVRLRASPVFSWLRKSSDFRIILFCKDKERAQTEATCIKNTGDEKQRDAKCRCNCAASFAIAQPWFLCLELPEVLTAQKCKTSGSFSWKWTKVMAWLSSANGVNNSHLSDLHMWIYRQTSVRTKPFRKLATTQTTPRKGTIRITHKASK